MPTASRSDAKTGERRESGPAVGDAALARAVVWRFLALGFAPPGPELRAALSDEFERLALAAALAELELTFRCAHAERDLEARFAELFGHTVRAAICAYETEFGGGQIFQQAQEMADLQGWYAAFGLERRPDVRERPDHVAVECEFAGFLCRKEAYMLAREDRGQSELIRQAYRRFLRDHLARFGMALTVRLERIDGDGFHGRLASLCREFLVAECRRVDVEPGPKALPLRPDTADDVPAACDDGADCDPSGGSDEGSSPFGRTAPRRLLSIDDRTGRGVRDD
jgi:TorA maturation chaperone TorD